MPELSRITVCYSSLKKALSSMTPQQTRHQETTRPEMTTCQNRIKSNTHDITAPNLHIKRLIFATPVNQTGWCIMGHDTCAVTEAIIIPCLAPLWPQKYPRNVSPNYNPVSLIKVLGSKNLDFLLNGIDYQLHATTECMQLAAITGDLIMHQLILFDPWQGNEITTLA